MAAETAIAMMFEVLGRMLPTTRTVTAIKTSAVAGVIGMLAGVFLMAAIGMGLAALWAAVAPRFGSAGASLLVAGVLMFVALTLLAVAWRVHRRGRRTPPPGLSAEQTDAIAKALGDLVGDHKAGALIAALWAGMAAERAGRR